MELYIARYVTDSIIRPFVGDMLVVILLYTGIRSFMSLPYLKLAVGVLLFAYGVFSVFFSSKDGVNSEISSNFTFMNCQHILEATYAQVLDMEDKGVVASYIPELAKVNPNHFGICITSQNGSQHTCGDAQTSFSIQSIAKVLSLSFALSLGDDSIWDRIDVEPSGSAFNSLVQLETENGIPRNPLINAGAIVVCDILCGHLHDPKAALLDYVRKVANNTTITFSKTMFHHHELL